MYSTNCDMNCLQHCISVGEKIVKNCFLISIYFDNEKW